MKKLIAKSSILALVASTFAFVTPVLAVTPNWTLVAPTAINFTCGGGAYPHTLTTVSQDGSGNLTGTGLYNPDPSYTWNLTGNISGNDITFTILYTGTAAGSVYNLTGTIASDGSISGTVDSNCQTFTMPAGSAVAIQSCISLELTSDTGTQFKGLTTTNPAGLSTDVLFAGGTSSAVVADSDGFPGAWDTAEADPDVAGASWVNNSATPPTNPAGAGGDGTVDSWRLFSESFTIPADATISSAVLHLSADNSVEAFLDNTSVGTALSYTTVEDIALTLTPGTHELEFVVKNDAYTGATNPTGLIYKAVVNYCIPLDCPAAPAIAAQLLKTHNVKAGTTTYKNYISEVAKHMGPQNSFDGKTACDTVAYRAAVNNYLDTVLNAY